MKQELKLFLCIFLVFLFCFTSDIPFQKTHAQTVNIPNDRGQIWKQYNISKYTSKFPRMSNPESAVMDWILMETGFEIWHSEIPAMLNVTRTTVNVYHIPQVQTIVEDLIQDFVNTDPLEHQFRVQIFTVNMPYWRQKIGNRLTPIPSFSMGSQAWTIAPEEMKDVLDILQKTPGFTNHASDAKSIPNGQSMRLNWLRTRNYVRNFFIRSGIQQKDEALLDDGFSFELMPLLRMNASMADAQIKFQVNHLDRFLAMNIDIPATPSRISEKINVPLIGQFRFRERYQWNTENALLVSPGLTPPLTSTGETSSGSLLNTTQRVETLILIEYRKNYSVPY